MLRITVLNDARCLTFQLEGRLAGRWVQELEECWQRTVATRQKSLVRVDLAGVTFECDEPVAARHDKAVVVGGRDTSDMTPREIDDYVRAAMAASRACQSGVRGRRRHQAPGRIPTARRGRSRRP